MATAENMENQIDSEMSFASALEDYLTPDMGDLEEGSIVKGEVVRVDDDTVLVDVNFKSEGQIPAEEFRDAQGNITVKVGDRREAVFRGGKGAGGEERARKEREFPEGRENEAERVREKRAGRNVHVGSDVRGKKMSFREEDRSS